MKTLFLLLGVVGILGACGASMELTVYDPADFVQSQQPDEMCSNTDWWPKIKCPPEQPDYKWDTQRFVEGDYFCCTPWQGGVFCRRGTVLDN